MLALLLDTNYHMKTGVLSGLDTGDSHKQKWTRQADKSAVYPILLWGCLNNRCYQMTQGSSVLETFFFLWFMACHIASKIEDKHLDLLFSGAAHWGGFLLLIANQTNTLRINGCDININFWDMRREALSYVPNPSDVWCYVWGNV